MKNTHRSIKYILALSVPAIIVVLISCCSTAWKSLQASLPDLDGRPDGVYRGEYDVSGTPVKVVLDVTVQNKALAAIKIIKHSSSPIGKRAEVITERVIAGQSLNVDVVSGATASSKAILKAVEDALR